MAKARALDRRRKSVKNIRKITRTMELIATARFKKAMDRSIAARDYTKHLAKILENIASVGADVAHPLLEIRPTERAAVLVLTGNRGLCGGYNSNIVRQSVALLGQWKSEQVPAHVSVSGKRGIAALKFRGVDIAERYTQFEDKPEFAAVAPIGRAYLDAYAAREIDRLLDRLAEVVGRRAPQILQVGSRSVLADRNERNWRGIVAKRFGPKASFIGIDLLPGNNVDRQVDICSRPEAIATKLEKTRFDLVICCHVLEHTRSPFQAAKNILGLMRSGGLC